MLEVAEFMKKGKIDRADRALDRQHRQVRASHADRCIHATNTQETADVQTEIGTTANAEVLQGAL